MSKIRLRKTLSVRGLLKVVRNCFKRIPDPIASRGVTQMDCLLSALAIFGAEVSFAVEVRAGGSTQAAYPFEPQGVVRSGASACGHDLARAS